MASDVKTVHAHNVLGYFHVSSKSTENREFTKCHQVTDHNCVYKKQSVSACKKRCTLGQGWSLESALCH